jgi:hypothetical protein
MKGIRKVDNDLAVPLFELLHNILVSGKGNSEEDHLSLISVLKGAKARASAVPILLRGLSGNCATIHWQVDSSDEAALVGSKEQGCRCKLICCSKSSHWDHLLEVIACTVVRFPSADMDHGRLRRSRTDYVCSNATAG